MGARRKPAEPGHRPRAGVRFVAGMCRVCREPFVADRATEGPWARPRTCSDTCRAILGNRGRNASNCRHCELVESYRLARDSDIRECIEIAGGDERHALTFHEFLTGWRGERPTGDDGPPADAMDEAEWLAAWGYTCVA